MTSHPAVVSRRDVLCLGAAAAALGPGALAADKDDAPPDLLIGYTEYRTDLPGGRYVNVATMRAVVSKADGTGRRQGDQRDRRRAGQQLQRRPGFHARRPDQAPLLGDDQRQDAALPGGSRR